MLKNLIKNNIARKLSIASGIVVTLLICCCFMIVQLANAGEKLSDSTSFGIGNQRFSVDAQVGVITDTEFNDPLSFESSQTTISTYSTRDISLAVSTIGHKKEVEAKAIAEAQKAAEIAHIAFCKNRRNEHQKKYGMPSDLTEINWDQGKDAFIIEWTIKLNRYFLGSPLANTGEIFAQSAWENGIDPRWSAAISNTESSKGLHCFNPYNAWGWGDSSWNNWIDAISDHVEGLSKSYGYTIHTSFAEKYCPPNCDNWYNNTLSEMKKIK